MRLIVPLVLALSCATAAAQLYSWKDAEGKVHYSDEPPPGKTPARKLAPPPPPANPPAAAAPKAAAEKDNKSGAPVADPAKEKAEADLRQANCERARANLKALESGAARFIVNAKGERVALEGAVLQAELDNARRAAEGWCK